MYSHRQVAIQNTACTLCEGFKEQVPKRLAFAALVQTVSHFDCEDRAGEGCYTGKTPKVESVSRNPATPCT